MCQKKSYQNVILNEVKNLDGDNICVQILRFAQDDKKKKTI